MKEGFVSLTLENPEYMVKKRAHATKTMGNAIVVIPKKFKDREVWVIVPREDNNRGTKGGDGK